MKGLLIFLAACVLFIVTVSVYLQPNSLAACSSKPTDGACSKADAIVVVSGGDTAGRADEGIRLYQDGWADMIVFSGAAQDKSGPSNARAMRVQAIAAGIPEQSISIDEEAVNTQQNAENTQSILTDKGAQRVVLVTSGYHQRRAALEFQRSSNNAFTVLSKPLLSDKDWSGFWWATPRGWWLAGGELVKIVAFYTGAGR